MPEDMIRWLYGLQHFGVKLGLDNIRALLDALGQPQDSYKTLHIAGTNGKGSVAAMVDALLAASDVRSGLFTSPHLMRPNERIRIAGADIGDDELQQRLKWMRERIERGIAEGALEAHPSFFEVITATALQSFKEHELEAAVLEVGLGGRLDATNAVNADVAAIVSVSHDHTKTLGDTLEKIAGEKAGIIKPGQPVVSGVVRQAALDVLLRTCAERGAEWVDGRIAARLVEDLGETFTLETSRRRYPDLRIALPGRHQIDNARVALVAFERLMERLERKPDPDRVRRGFAEMRWPGRLQWIHSGGSSFLLDGAHNPAGMGTLVHYVRSRDRARPWLVFGATRGKPVERLLASLAPLVEGIVLTRPPVDKGIDPEEIAVEARHAFDPVVVEPDVGRALDRARELASEESYVLVTGSLYMVGEALGRLERQTTPGPIAM